MSTTVPTIAIAAPPMPVTLDGALGGGQLSSAIARTYFPLTPSPTSPFRAHRHPGANSKPPRPKPYHRPNSQVADLKLHNQHANHTQCGTIVGTGSPFSPITPTSLSSASSSTVTTPSTLSYGYQPSRLSRCHSAFVSSAEDELQLQQQKQHQHQQFPQQGLDGLLTPLSTSSLPRRRQGLQRTGSAPLLVACPPISAINQCNLTCNSNNVSIPVFASTSDRPQAAPASSPVVFTADYLEARLAKFGGKIGGPPPQPQVQQQQHKPQCVPAALGYQDQPDILSLIKDFPYASAYVDVSSVPQPQASRSQDSGVMAQAAPAAHARDEEIRKQRYAVDLIETAIKTIHKIWPETQEPDREAAPGPVTSEGKLRASFITQFPPTAVPTAAQDKATARLRRRPSHQQFTPESSPDSSKKKRKRGDACAGSEGARDGDEKVCKRSCVGETKMAYPTCPRVLTPMPELKPEPAKAAPPQSHHISLKLFVRELLRRSKTSCNTLEVALCYLDGVEETVKKLRDCLKLGIAFGTVAMAERGPYDEGMKDEGRIITAVEWMRQEAMKQEDDRMDVRGDWPHHQQGQEWAPLSPPGSDSSSDRGTKASTAATPTNQILATHPLLDARRTFLASLVLATKFIQDKAYSNKAWAKLSGLAGKEVGRCERALGGALQWRLWVGKECGGNSSIRGRSPLGNEEVESLCSGDSETVVHGENDPLAKAFMEEAMKKQKSVSKWDAELSTPTAVAPAEVVARLYGDALTNSRANGSGRARTWHAPEKVDEESGALLPLAGPTPHVPLRSSAISVASSCSTLLDQLSSFNLRSVTPMSHASQTTVVDSRHTTAFGMPFVHSPLSLESEQLLNALLKGGEECEAPATVKMHVDDSASGKNKTPVMSMATSFANNEPLPLAGFMDSWQPQSSFPFTFTALPPSKLQPLQQLPRLSIPKPQVQQRSQSLGSLPLPLPRLLHPQTAALRASGGSGSSTSPHSSSTFSSPEVLTPVHSRAGTLVEVAEYYQDWMGRGKEFQQCVDQLYCGNNGNQFGVGMQAPALQL